MPARTVGKKREKQRGNAQGDEASITADASKEPVSNTASSTVEEQALSCYKHFPHSTKRCQLALQERHRERNHESPTRTHCSVHTQTAYSGGWETTGGFLPCGSELSLERHS